MKSKYRFRRILSGVMAAVTILSTFISPLTVYASEEPKAAEPPALLIRATTTPRTTRKMKIPAVPETAPISPSLTRISIVLVNLKSEPRIEPARIPTNNEL